ncbi:hypothetical protein PGTUg99_021847 [Puccinia graminis f. sp. tritici]|uniref:Uncharacterized protein n=1 Tax=Puccinia graminis f. sp. tritici TaxID=56615 RepID=A0A5B0SDX2_PUCGR|nr:hypothetical protein PGTUg99_021847 [Puccinia graminis f. sp. tritici]
MGLFLICSGALAGRTSRKNSEKDRGRELRKRARSSIAAKLPPTVERPLVPALAQLWARFGLIGSRQQSTISSCATCPVDFTRDVAADIS